MAVDRSGRNARETRQPIFVAAALRGGAAVGRGLLMPKIADAAAEPASA